MVKPTCGFVRTKFSQGSRKTLPCMSRCASLSGRLRSTSSIATQCVTFGCFATHFLISLHLFSLKEEWRALITPGVAWSKSGVAPYSGGILYSSSACAMPSCRTSCFRQSEDSTMRAPVFWITYLSALMAEGQKSMPALASLLPRRGTLAPPMSMVRACWNASCLLCSGRSTPSTSRKSTFAGSSSGGGSGSNRGASGFGVYSVLVASGRPS
mmetsp:Transcript_52872/g.153860  ORF Transcript_52872/g.153860 Transcript_52872/m.153860 type:complete len:212 (+) Transcript_52872:362-997(+)